MTSKNKKEDVYQIQKLIEEVLEREKLVQFIFCIISVIIFSSFFGFLGFLISLVANYVYYVLIENRWKDKLKTRYEAAFELGATMTELKKQKSITAWMTISNLDEFISKLKKKTTSNKNEKKLTPEEEEYRDFFGEDD